MLPESRVFISEEGDTSSAVQSGMFQQFSLKADWKRQFKKHQISLGGKTRFDYFPGLTEANLFRPEARLNYAYIVNKNQSFFFKSRYIMHRTDRIPDETSVLILPRSYQRWQSDLGYKFRPFDNNRSQVQLSVFRKIYDPSENRSLMYDAFQVNFKTKQRFKQKGRPSKYLTLELDFAKRNYLDERFEEEGEGSEEIINYRNWQYHTVDVEYSFAPSKKLRWKPGIAFQQRLDILDEKFGYRQVEPYLKVGFEEEKVSLDLKLQTTFRYYTGLEAAKDSEALLRHQYLRVGMSFKYSPERPLGYYCKWKFQETLEKPVRSGDQLPSLYKWCFQCRTELPL
jgi:hypothetical protein